MTSGRFWSPASCGPIDSPPMSDQRTDALGAAEHVERLRDLQRELARRREHERARPRPAATGERGIHAGEAFEHRNRECGGLAGAGLRASDHVAAFEDRPDRLGLNRSWRGIAGAGDGVAHRRCESRIIKRTEHEDRTPF